MTTTSQILGLILDESKWFPAAFACALAVTGWSLLRAAGEPEGRGLSSTGRSASLMNLFYGCLIAVMGFGHLLAVTVKLFQGTLQGSPWLLYPLGLALAVPAGWLAGLQLSTTTEPARSKTTLGLNLWLVVALLASGPHNWPLAVLALLNIACRYQTRPAFGRALVGITLVAYVALFAGSLVFLASGQSFEQFAGIE